LGLRYIFAGARRGYFALFSNTGGAGRDAASGLLESTLQIASVEAGSGAEKRQGTQEAERGGLSV
jgi:hypothetical protein